VSGAAFFVFFRFFLLALSRRAQGFFFFFFFFCFFFIFFLFSYPLFFFFILVRCGFGRMSLVFRFFLSFPSLTCCPLQTLPGFLRTISALLFPCRLPKCGVLSPLRACFVCGPFAMANTLRGVSSLPRLGSVLLFVSSVCRGSSGGSVLSVFGQCFGFVREPLGPMFCQIAGCHVFLRIFFCFFFFFVVRAGCSSAVYWLKRIPPYVLPVFGDRLLNFLYGDCFLRVASFRM